MYLYNVPCLLPERGAAHLSIITPTTNLLVRTGLLHLAFVAVTLATAQAQTPSFLHTFGSVANDGASPVGPLTLSGSKLFGMTIGGGTGSGTIFSMNTDGSGYSVLRSLAPIADGINPFGSLSLSGSKLYGMANDGGSSNFCGTIFSMNTNGSGFSILRRFAGGSTDGSRPFGSLTLFGSQLYGMTYYGGTANQGTVFRLNTDGSGFSLLKSLNTAEGSFPRSSSTLTLADSKLYGMTQGGGANNRGVIFSMNTDGSGYSLLRSLNTADGIYPEAALTLAGSKIYGLTPSGGSNGSGTIFSLNTDGSGFSVIKNFAGGANDGANPYGSLTLVGSTFYGMTYNGGASDKGTLFKIEADGSGFSVLDSFSGGPTEGADPYSSLTLSTDGNTLYGVTTKGGTNDNGVVFTIAVPEPSSFALLALSCTAVVLTIRRRVTPVERDRRNVVTCPLRAPVIASGSSA